MHQDLTPNKLSKETQKSMKVRIITGIIGLAVVIPLIIFGEWAFLVFAIIAAVLGAYELVACAKRVYNPLLYIVTILLVTSLSCIPLLRNLFSSTTYEAGEIWHLYNGFDSIYASVTIMAIGALLIFMMPLIDKNFEVRDACFIFAFGVIIGLGVQSLLFIRYFPMYCGENLMGLDMTDPKYNFGWSTALFFLIVGGACINDVGAYFIGVLFGKHKMLERISPKKTWEGFAGGVFFTMAYVLTLGLTMAEFNDPLLPILDSNHWYVLLVLSIVIPLVSVLGDFIFSSIKRYYGIKDFGYVLPGHGGVLDRLDSILFAAISSTLILILVNSVETGNWGGLLV